MLDPYQKVTTNIFPKQRLLDVSPGSWSQDEEFMCPKTEIQSHSLWLTLGTLLNGNAVGGLPE